MNNPTSMLRAVEGLQVFQSGCIPHWVPQTCLQSLGGVLVLPMLA